MKKRKMIFCVVLFILFFIGIWSAREIYGYYNPNVIISYRVEEKEDLYLSMPSYAIEARSKFGYANRYNEEMKDWWTATNEVEVWLRTELKKPINVTSNVEIVDGKTVITYKGTALSLENETISIDKQIVMDFVVSKNIPKE
ncbi:hypothetical protein [Holdemanella sp.]|uniref:hypothetical protein n=1 Tax=Holdemanella sp. TaxID=1971762 RepID=UPI003AF03C5E